MKNFLVLLSSCLILSITGCTKNKISKNTATACKSNVVKDCICTLQYDPVCGCDGKTYGNECEAKCAGLTSWTKGECR